MSNITIHDKDDPLGANKRRDLALYYRTHGQVHLAVWGTFTVGANGDPVAGSYVPSAAREFRYHTDPRARYAWRDWITNGGSSDYTTWTAAGPLHWTDYDGAEPYLDGDITFDAQQNPAVTVGVQLFGSAGQRTAATGATRYFHADLVGSVGLRSDSSGAAAGRITYTAFGEVVSRTTGTEDQRYAYCGEHGYESGLLALDGKPGSAPVTLLHLRARWYQPGVGRFVQRDPFGLEGGANLYAYGACSPTATIDPLGFFPSGGLRDPISEVIKSIRARKLLDQINKLPWFQRVVLWATNLVKHPSWANVTNLLRAVFNRPNMLLLAAVCFHTFVVEPAVAAARDFAEDYRRTSDSIGAGLRGWQAGFNWNESQEIFGLP